MPTQTQIMDAIYGWPTAAEITERVGSTINVFCNIRALSNGFPPRS